MTETEALKRLKESPFHLSIGEEQSAPSESPAIENRNQGSPEIIGIGIQDGFDFSDKIG